MSRSEPVSRRERPAKPALSRAAIVDAAMKVLEQDGIGKLTMRRVAAELDTGPASLYVYVANTTELHALLLDRLLGSLDLTWDEVEPWRDRLHRVLADYVELVSREAGLARAALFVWPDGPHYLDLVELILRLLLAAGVDERTAAWGVDLLLQHAGASVAEWSTRAADSGQRLEDVAAQLDAADSERNPVLGSFDTALFTQGHHTTRTLWALEAVITGILDVRFPSAS